MKYNLAAHVCFEGNVFYILDVKKEPVMNDMPGATDRQYNKLDSLYACYNNALFGNSLPDCITNISRQIKEAGSLIIKNWEGSASKETPLSYEILLNPEKFTCKCGENTWGKKGLELQCKKCGGDLIREDLDSTIGNKNQGGADEVN